MKQIICFANFCTLITIGDSVCYENQDNCLSYSGCAYKSKYKCCSLCEPGFYVSTCWCVWDPLKHFAQIGSWCTQGYDLGNFNVTRHECAYICDLMSDCIGFEYYFNQTVVGGGDDEQVGVCRPKYGGLLNASRCSGNLYSWDLDYYFKDPEGFLMVGNTMCGGGNSWVTHTITYDVNLPTNVTVTWDRTISGCATLCDTMGAETCQNFWVHGKFPLFEICVMFSDKGTIHGGTNTFCYERSVRRSEDLNSPTKSIAGEDGSDRRTVYLVEDGCTNGWFANIPQYTDGHNTCQYSCNGRRRNVNNNKSFDFRIADNVLGHTINKTWSEGSMKPVYSVINSPSTARRLSVGAMFQGLAELVSIVEGALGIADTIKDWSSSDSDLDSALCSSDSVLQCLNWARCVTCGLLFGIGMNLSSIEKCRTTPHNLMEKQKNHPRCLNVACEGVVVENDRMVYDCANPTFSGCLGLYMKELDGGDSGNENGCCKE